MKKLLIIITTLTLVLGIGTLLAINWYKKNTDSDYANYSMEKSYRLIVESGDSTESILTELEENEIIRSKLAARIYLKLNPSIIQAGKFDLYPYMSLQKIFEILSNAEDETVWVTIPEGLRYDEIAAIWAEKVEGFDAVRFNKLAETKLLTRDSAEGYLFPDTYNVKKEITEEEAFDLMYNNFQTKVGDIRYDTLILASIVEREAKTNDERPVVAGILKKRLDTAGWLLQADATLLYEVKDWKATITQQLKNSTSMYNTYYNPDLPPTPICNPGLKSIEAARNPQTDTPYWYYLHGKDGQIRYATTLEQHNQNIYTYLR